MAKKPRLDPNRFKKGGKPAPKLDDKGLFSFDPIRRDLFKWGLVAGASGGFLMLQPGIFWQITGVFVVVFIANYHISKASKQIPRWQATIISFIGAMLAIVLMALLTTLTGVYLQTGGGG